MRKTEQKFGDVGGCDGWRGKRYRNKVAMMKSPSELADTKTDLGFSSAKYPPHSSAQTAHAMGCFAKKTFMIVFPIRAN